MKKNNSLKIFNLIARRVFKIFKKRKLGLKWNDAQKWTSANIFKSYKGKPISKIRLTDVDKEIVSILDEAPISEVCASVMSLPDSDIEDIPFWILEDAIFGGNGKLGFEDTLKVAIEFDDILSTGIIKKGDLSRTQIKQIINDIRKYLSGIGENYYTIIFLRKKIPNTNDTENPCNTYLLITSEGSSYDNNDNEIEELISEKNLTPEEREKREKRKTETEAVKQKKSTQKFIKKKDRPQQVEPRTKGSVDTEGEKYKALQFALEILRADVKEGLITKKQYQDRQKLILDKFNLGGEI